MKQAHFSYVVIAFIANVIVAPRGVAADNDFSSRSEAMAKFDDFVSWHDRTYKAGTNEYEHRFQLYLQTLKAVELQNNKPNRLWSARVNHFADWSVDEVQSLNGWNSGMRYASSAAGGGSSLLNRSSSGAAVARDGHQSLRATKRHSLGEDLPDEHDWSGKLWALDKEQVHHQSCGNCWAAATATVLESHYQIHTDNGSPRHFSIAEITDCTANPYHCGGSGGCSGAIPELALSHILKNGISDSTADDGKVECPNDMQDIVPKDEQGTHEFLSGERTGHIPAKQPGHDIGLIGWNYLQSNKEEPLRRAIVQNGPVAVAVATDWKTTGYDKGVYDGCGKDAAIGHAVVAIGYGTDKNIEGGTKYWKIQNSWGQSWGEDGHMRLLRHGPSEEEYCGTDSSPQSGSGCDGGPSEVKVCGMCGIIYDAVVPEFEDGKKRFKDTMNMWKQRDAKDLAKKSGGLL